MFRQFPSSQIPMVKHSLISVTHRRKNTHTAVSRWQHEVSHKKRLTTNDIFHVSDDADCVCLNVKVCVCVPLQIPSTSSNPAGQEQL